MGNDAHGITDDHAETDLQRIADKRSIRSVGQPRNSTVRRRRGGLLRRLIEQALDMSGQRSQRIGEGCEILDLRGTRLANMRWSDLDDASTESVHRRSRAGPRGRGWLVGANGDVRRQFARDLV